MREIKLGNIVTYLYKKGFFKVGTITLDTSLQYSEPHHVVEMIPIAKEDGTPIKKGKAERFSCNLLKQGSKGSHIAVVDSMYMMDIIHSKTIEHDAEMQRLHSLRRLAFESL